MASAALNYANGDGSHIYGPSTSTQRIESWGLRGLHFWIDIFNDLEKRGDFNTADDFVLICSWFVFGPFVQNAIRTVADIWNHHKIRKQKESGFAGGRILSPIGVP